MAGGSWPLHTCGCRRGWETTAPHQPLPFEPDRKPDSGSWGQGSRPSPAVSWQTAPRPARGEQHARQKPALLFPSSPGPRETRCARHVQNPSLPGDRQDREVCPDAGEGWLPGEGLRARRSTPYSPASCPLHPAPGREGSLPPGAPLRHRLAREGQNRGDPEARPGEGGGAACSRGGGRSWEGPGLSCPPLPDPSLKVRLVPPPTPLDLACCHFMRSGPRTRCRLASARRLDPWDMSHRQQPPIAAQGTGHVRPKG